MGENSKYVGVPILPPVITPNKSRELLKYKQQAIKLEQRLQNCRDLRRNLDELLEAQNNSTRPVSQLTFGDDSHIEALDISDKPKVPRRLKDIQLSSDLIEVTEYSTNGLQTICSNIRLGIDDASNNKPDCDREEIIRNQQSTSKDSSHTETDCYRSRSASVPRREADLKPPETLPKPRLIRSNSYTLEAPSPVLLEHLRKTSCNDFNTNLNGACNWASPENNRGAFESSDFGSMTTVLHRESNDLSEVASSPDKSAKYINEVKSPTIEVYQTDISVQQITVNTSSANGSCKEDKKETFFTKDPFGTLEPDSELLNFLKEIPDVYAYQIIELLKKQHIEQKERLARYDNLNETSEKMWLSSDVFRTEDVCRNDQKYEEKSETSNQTVPPPIPHASSQIDANCDNLIDLSSLSEHDLVGPSTSHRTNYSNHLTNYNDPAIHSNPSNYSDLTYYSNRTNCSNPTNYSEPITIHSNPTNHSRPNTNESTKSARCPSGKLRRSSTFSMSPSQSLSYGSTSDSDTTRMTQSVNMIDLGGGRVNGGDDNLEIGVLREKNGYWEGVVMHESGNVNCSRELFPQIDPVTMNSLKKEWAASVIGAHVKGFLTRRLIRTEKVQALVATIKDVLVCALELHQSDNIDEKDVELHRRLINQLSAALYSFHEIFFELSTSERMSIISTDRHRRLEKLKRPQSGRPSSRKSVSSSRSDKSLASNRSSASSKQKLISGSPAVLPKCS